MLYLKRSCALTDSDTIIAFAASAPSLIHFLSGSFYIKNGFFLRAIHDRKESLFFASGHEIFIFIFFYKIFFDIFFRVGDIEVNCYSSCEGKHHLRTHHLHTHHTYISRGPLFLTSSTAARLRSYSAFSFSAARISCSQRRRVHLRIRQRRRNEIRTWPFGRNGCPSDASN